ncbi:MAG: hypothetical protein HDT14_02560 [Oscillibacter sp.]|nr:hypothetical protein [Oscillibacter sp.]
MIAKVLVIIFPILLFAFKYVLPIIAEAAYSKEKPNYIKLLEELFEFPLDIIFIAISYIIPKIIEILNLLAAKTLENQDISQYVVEVMFYFGISIFMLFLLPFLVFLVKLAINYHHQNDQKARNILVGILYVISIACIAFSLFLY